MVEFCEDTDARVRLEAVIAAGQLSAAEQPDAISAVLRALVLDVDANLDFAIWQSLRQLDDSLPEGSVLTTIDTWENRHAELAYAIEAINTPAAAEVGLTLLELQAVPQYRIETLVRAIAVAGDAAQLGRLLSTQLSADPGNLSRKRLKPLFDRTRRDGTVPDGAASGLIAVLGPLQQQGLLDITVEVASGAEAPSGAMFTIDLLGQDRLGIIRDLAHGLAAIDVSIDELTTETRDAPMAGGLLFEAHASLTGPPRLTVHALEDAIAALGKDFQIDVAGPLEP